MPASIAALCPAFLANLRSRIRDPLRHPSGRRPCRRRAIVHENESVLRPSSAAWIPALREQGHSDLIVGKRKPTYAEKSGALTAEESGSSDKNTDRAVRRARRGRICRRKVTDLNAPFDGLRPSSDRLARDVNGAATDKGIFPRLLGEIFVHDLLGFNEIVIPRPDPKLAGKILRFTLVNRQGDLRGHQIMTKVITHRRGKRRVAGDEEDPFMAGARLFDEGAFQFSRHFCSSPGRLQMSCAAKPAKGRPPG